MSDHRWQGYTHAELYDHLHNGPGAEASIEPARRWAELTRVLGEIDGDITAALTQAMSGWEGDAGEHARQGLRPLSDWANEARQASEIMRDRAEQQANFVGQARADMPPPQQIQADDPSAAESWLVHLFGGQTDREVQEAAQDAAEQRAFDVMRVYESSTTANTTSLASFTPPPQVTVDSPAVRAGGSAAIQQPVTITVAPTAPPAIRTAAPGATARPGRGGGASWRQAAGGGLAGASGSSHSSTGGGSRTAQGTASAPRHRPEREDQVDRAVTESRAGTGGFFDDPRTLSRPVIGGEPG